MKQQIWCLQARARKVQDITPKYGSKKYSPCKCANADTMSMHARAALWRRGGRRSLYVPCVMWKYWEYFPSSNHIGSTRVVNSPCCSKVTHPIVFFLLSIQCRCSSTHSSTDTVFVYYCGHGNATVCSLRIGIYCLHLCVEAHSE